MQELYSADSVATLKAAPIAVVLFAPPWSVYAVRALKAFEAGQEDFERHDLDLFVSIEDRPHLVPGVAEWLHSHRDTMPLIGMGSGEIALCEYGVPVYVETVVWNRPMKDLALRLVGWFKHRSKDQT